MQDLAHYLGLVRKTAPLIFQITNYVTVNDCANMTICIGASPVMAHFPEDAVELTQKSDALVLNIGTPDDVQITVMKLCANEAKKSGIPVILDPVGAGATEYRTKCAMELLPYASVIKGNAGEIAVLAGFTSKMKGVDCESVSGDAASFAKELAKKTGAVVIVSGKEDIITDGTRTAGIFNGVELMSRVSGTGCMASSAVAAFCAPVCKNRSDELFNACIAAMAYAGIAGETAAKTARGPGTFKPAFFDAAAGLTEDDFAQANIREYP
ncbi:MAG TPA: hydroxyethylthiazole kinase [Methanocorpusculum sp.]|nr:hydroxyethylthiazole kinase [Methanocorpusculum sp.]